MRRRAAALAVVAVLVGCGVPQDSEPRDIPPDQQGELASPGPAPVEDPTAAGPKVYFLRPAADGEEQLQPASRDVPPTAQVVLAELLKGVTSVERGQRWRTAIPSGTELLDATLRTDGTLVVDLSDPFFQATGDAQVKAVAQIVFTSVAVDGVGGVLLLVDGQQRDWPRGDGSLESEPLTEFDYPGLNPTSQPDFPPIPAPVAAAAGG